MTITLILILVAAFYLVIGVTMGLNLSEMGKSEGASLWMQTFGFFIGLFLWPILIIAGKR